MHASLSPAFRTTPPESPVTPTGSDSRVADWTEHPPSTEMDCLERIATVFIDAIARLLSSVFSVIRSCLQMIHLVAPDSAATTRPRREALPIRVQEPVPPCIDRIQPGNEAQDLASGALHNQMTAMRTQMDQNGIEVAPDSAATTYPRREALPIRVQEPVPPCIDRIQPGNEAQDLASGALHNQMTAMRTQMDQNGIEVAPDSAATTRPRGEALPIRGQEPVPPCIDRIQPGNEAQDLASGAMTAMRTQMDQNGIEVAPDSAATTRPRREALPIRGQEPVPPCIDRIQPRNAAQRAASAALRTQITAMRTQMNQNGIGMEYTEDALEFALLHLDNAAEGDGAPLTAMETLLRRIGDAPSARANTRVVLYSLSQILDSCLANGEFLQATVLSATQMQTDCLDRVETFFRQMRLCWELQCNPEMREPANLERLLIGIERVHLIEQIVRRNYPGGEELEANLYCLIRLKTELTLPESTPSVMDHSWCVSIGDEALQRIKDEVLNRTRQIPDLCRILCVNPEWETVMWSQQVTPSLVTVVEDLSALLPTGAEEGDAPLTWLNVLRTLASCLSIEDVQGVLEQIVQGDPINQDASIYRRQEAQRQRDARVALRDTARQQVARWTPAVEAPLEAAELEVCRHLLSTLIVLGDRFNGDLPEEINEGSVMKILELLKQIKHYAVRNATVVCLQERGN